MGVGGQLDFGYHYFLGGQGGQQHRGPFDRAIQGMLLADFTFHLGVTDQRAARSREARRG